MLIFCENELLGETYAEVLCDFNPVLFSKEADFIKKITPSEFLIVDEKKDLCKQLTEKTDCPPVLFISTQEENIDECFFLKKPFTAARLHHEVSLLVAKHERGLLVNFSVNGFTFCGKTRTINDIPLTQKEAELVELLYENRGQVLTKEQILQSVFGYTQDTQTHTLETHIYKLRQKIADSDAKFITTTDGGYTLEA